MCEDKPKLIWIGNCDDFFFSPCCFNLAKTVFLNSLPCVVQVRVGCKGILYETAKAGAPLSPKGLCGPGYWQRMRTHALTLCWLPGWAWRSNGAAAAPAVAHALSVTLQVLD